MEKPAYTEQSKEGQLRNQAKERNISTIKDQETLEGTS